MQCLDLICELTSHKDRVWHLTWDAKGKRIASCGGDKTIRIWEEVNKNWTCKAQLVEGHQRTIRKVAWSPCGKRIASASFDSTVGIWEKEPDEFDCTATLEGHENEVKGVSWSISGSYLASCSRDKSVWIWDSYEEDFECAGVLTSHKQDVKDVKWSPMEDILASCSYDNTINLYEEDDGEWITSDTLTGHESTVWSISWHRSGNMLASASDDKTVKIWKRYHSNNTVGIAMGGKKTAWKCICTLSGYHERSIYSIDWNQVNDMIVTGGGDDCIRVFSYAKGSSSEDDDPTFELVCSVPNAHAQDINIVAWNPTDSNILASASDDCAIKLWKISN